MGLCRSQFDFHFYFELDEFRNCRILELKFWRPPLLSDNILHNFLFNIPQFRLHQILPNLLYNKLCNVKQLYTVENVTFKLIFLLRFKKFTTAQLFAAESLNISQNWQIDAIDCASNWLSINQNNWGSANSNCSKKINNILHKKLCNM